MTLKRDDNSVTVLGAVTDDSNQTVENLIVDPTTKRLKVTAIVPAGLLTSINSDSTPAQTITIGTTGTDIAIVDNTAGDHKINIPTASHANRGALSSTDWDTFNGKQPAGSYVTTDQSTPQTIGATGARLSKLWVLDITCTNTIAGAVSGNAGTVTNATLTTALTVNTGTVTLIGNVANSSVLTIGAGAVSVSGSNTGDQTLSSLGAEAVGNKATTFGTINDTLYPSVKAVNDQIISAVAGLLDYRGAYDASTNLFPATGGSGTLGAILKGDFWICSVAGALGGTAVTAGDLIIALQDTPAQTASNWDLVEHDLGYAPENSANKVTSISGSSTDVQYPSAKLVYDQLAGKAATAQTMYIGTTGVAINRGTGALSLAGVSIDGSSGSCAGNSATVTGFSLTAGKTLTVSDSATIANASITLANTKVLTLTGSLTASADATVSGTNTGDNAANSNIPVKASGAEINTGTDDAKFATAKAILDANIFTQAWTSYNPTPTNFVKGAGGTLEGFYTRIGKTVICRVHFKFGTDSSVSGNVLVSLPVTSISYEGLTSIQILGDATFLDSGTAVFYGYTVWNSTTTVQLQVSVTSGTYAGSGGTSSTIPMTWATNDEFFAQFIYAAA